MRTRIRFGHVLHPSTILLAAGAGGTARPAGNGDRPMLMARTERPLLRPEADWEIPGIFTAVAAFLEEDGHTVRLYYHVGFPETPKRNLLCLARSADLSGWERPDLGDGTNVVLRGSGTELSWGAFMPCSISRSSADDFGLHAWRMLYWDRPEGCPEPGFCLAASRDGLSWALLGDRPFITGANDAASMIDWPQPRSSPLGRGNCLVYQQTWKHNPLLPADRDNLKGLHRRISLWQAAEPGGPWRGPIVVLEPDGEDPPDVQFYWLTPFPAGRGLGGLLHTHHTTDQTMDVQLVGSTDGWSWSRALGRKSVLGLGPAGGFDCGIVSAWPQPLRRGDRDLLFYSGRATVHDGQPRNPGHAGPWGGIGLAEFAAGALGAAAWEGAPCA